MPLKRARKTGKTKLPTANLEGIADSIRQSFSAKDLAREKALRLCREVIRYSANTIRAVHRQEFDEAGKLLKQTRGLLDEVGEILAGHQDLFHAGLVHDSQKEFAEASITMALVSGKPLPVPEALKVGLPAYLNGLGEAAGEMRRHVLDQLRKGDLANTEEKLAMMDDIYGVLVTMDFPDAITGGLRRTTDMVRGVLERTRGDLTLALELRALGAKLESFRRKRKVPSPLEGEG
ncbi:MAG TPA: haloacid dehalogenase [Dehalococcoidia bacterium]|nr:haloacid dehalogenase [Dehalococcoidia bacterium]